VLHVAAFIKPDGQAALKDWPGHLRACATLSPLYRPLYEKVLAELFQREWQNISKVASPDDVLDTLYKVAQLSRFCKYSWPTSP